MAEAEVDTGLLPVEVNAELEQKLLVHPLPEGIADADMNQDEMAQALDTTINTLAKWIKLADDPLPVVQGGGPGKPYVLRLSHCWAWKEARDAAEARRQGHVKAQISMLQAKYLGVDTEDDMARLSGKQQRDLAEAALRHAQVGQLRRRLVPLEETIAVMESVMSIVRDGMKAAPDRLERELGLKPEEVALVERLCDDILNTMADEIEAAELRERDLGEADLASPQRMLV